MPQANWDAANELASAQTSGDLQRLRSALDAARAADVASEAIDAGQEQLDSLEVQETAMKRAMTELALAQTSGDIERLQEAIEAAKAANVSEKAIAVGETELEILKQPKKRSTTFQADPLSPLGRSQKSPSSSFGKPRSTLPVARISPAATGNNPSLTTGAFEGAVNAHNALLESFETLESRVSTMSEEQIRCFAAIQSDNEERDTRTSAIEEHCRLQGDEFETLKKKQADDQRVLQASVEKLIVASREQEQTISSLEEELPPQLKGLAKSVEDIVRKQSEIVGQTLPNWQAELSGEIKKLAKDFSKLRDSTAGTEPKLEDMISQGLAAEDGKRKELEQRMNDEAVVFELRFSKNEGEINSVKQALQQASEKLDQADTALSQRIEEQCEQLMTFAREEAASAKQFVLTECSTRISDIEKAFKQAEFERLRSTETFEQQIDGLRAALASTGQETSQKAEAGIEQNRAFIDQCKTQLDTKATVKQTDDLSSRLASVEELLTSLQKAQTHSDERLDSTTSALLAKFESQQSTLENRITYEGDNSSRELRAELDAKFAGVQASLDKSGKDCRELADKLDKENDELRASISAAQAAAIEDARQSMATLGGRLEPVSQAIKSVSNELEELSKVQEQTEGGMQKMMEELETISRKFGPIDEAQRRLLEMEWYLSAERSMPLVSSSCLSCGRRAPGGNRSTSPPGSANRTAWSASTRSGGMFGDAPQPPVAVGWSWKAQPQIPATARPSSATYRRTGEMFESVGSQAENPPAGPAISAARFQRKGISSATSTTVGSTATVSSPPASGVLLQS